MKKKLLFAIAACAFFLPATVFAAKAPEIVKETLKDSKGNDVEVYSVYANGTPITIEARTDGQEGAIIKWDGGQENVIARTSVFAGAHNSNEIMENASITMNGGTIKNIWGGGEHKSIVEKVTITLNNGTVTGAIMGGGMRYGDNTHADFTEPQESEMNSRDDAITIVDEAIITINGGKVTEVYGGGESYSYTGKATVTINSTYTETINYLTAGGSNGYTGHGYLNIYGGKINVVQGINRGIMETVTTKVEGGEIKNLYAGGEPDGSVTGVINDSIELTVVDGTIENIGVGTSGGKDSLATDLVESEINAKFEQKIGNDFDADATTVTVNLMLIAGNEGETIQIPKGTVFTAEELQAMIDEINNELAADNLELVGFYLDEELTQEFDFSTPIDQDMELYMKLKELTPEQRVENPETSDVNIFLILSLVAVGAFGTTLVLKNRLS